VRVEQVDYVAEELRGLLDAQRGPAGAQALQRDAHHQRGRQRHVVEIEAREEPVDKVGRDVGHGQQLLVPPHRPEI
jgi:hypothetical protein